MSTSSTQQELGQQRPEKLHANKSFTRFEPSPPAEASPRRSRASTLANEILSEAPTDPLSLSTSNEVTPLNIPTPEAPASSNTSIFEKQADDSDADTPTERLVTSPLDNLPDDFDSLPIEIASWTDRFVNDLTSAKVFSQPPNIDTLSSIFQDFYVKAHDRIGTHIKALATKQSRTNSPASPAVKRPRPSPRLGSAASRDELRSSSLASSGADSGQPMLTPGEVHERRRAKKLLEYKRQLLEETAERRVTEALYDKLWRHRSSLDEVRDDKLRGKTGSLQLVGIGLKELGVDLQPSNIGSEEEQTTAERAVMVEEWISKAAEGLLKMNGSKNPKGKLDELITAHQKIVDLLTKVHRGSSSADEILPTLIYTLIACPAEGLNIISNMNFIQRFRSTSRMSGEAAYCLTNLEAAITFLETVDLASLRDEEAVDTGNAAKAPGSQPPTPLTATFTPSKQSTVSSTSAASSVNAYPTKYGASAEGSSEAALKPQRPASQLRTSSHHRRLSSLMSFPTNAFNTANDAVRSTADQSIRTVSATLDNSFKLLFGRLQQQQAAQSISEDDPVKSPVIVPKTLDEARKLVTPRLGFDDDLASDNSSFQGADDNHPLKDNDSTEEPKGDKVLGLIAGKGKSSSIADSKSRDRSVDSKASDKSSLRSKKSTGLSLPTASNIAATGALDNAAETFRSIGSSFNPLNRLSGAGFMSMRNFGRTTTPPTVEQAMPLPAEPSNSTETGVSVDRSPGVIVASILSPPLQPRFTNVKEVTELRVGELQDLLDEYHRVVNFLTVNNLI